MIRLGTYFGTRFGIDYLFLLLPLAALYFQGPMAAAWIMVLMASVMLHEIGHAYAASRYGFSTERIVMHVYGGTAYIDGLDRATNRQSIVIAIAGPAVSFLIFLVAGGAHTLLGFKQLETLSDMNFILAAFNMIPIFPLDGGRVSFATLRLLMDDSPRAAWVAFIISAGCMAMAVGAFCYMHMWMPAAILVLFGYEGLQYLKRQARSTKLSNENRIM